jgi:hypothetical protein
MNPFQGIIDIFDGNDAIDLHDALRRGVHVILHRTSSGTYKKDALYENRKQQAFRMGFLCARRCNPETPASDSLCTCMETGRPDWPMKNNPQNSEGKEDYGFRPEIPTR